MPEFQPSLFSTRIKSGRRTFFFDVNLTKEEKPYLKITESSINGEEKKRVKLNVFDSEIAEFQGAVSEAVNFIQQRNQ